MGDSNSCLYGNFHYSFGLIGNECCNNQLVVELNTTLSVIQAIIALYALIIASFMLLGSKLQDILGRKKTFIFGLLIYGSGTTIATLSINAAMLLIGWAVLEGVGAAMMFPATTTILVLVMKVKIRSQLLEFRVVSQLWARP